MEGPELPESARGLRMVLCLINSGLVLAGAALASLGAELDRFIASRDLGDSPPPLWWLGVTPLLVGATGFVSAASGKRKLVVCWVVSTSFLGAGSYTILSLSGCLDSPQYGVAVQIYGTCHDAGGQCECNRLDGMKNTLGFSTCEDIKHLTTYYLAMVVILILSLGVGTTGTILGCVATMCIHHCLPKEQPPYAGTTMLLQSPGHATHHKTSSSGASSICESLVPSPLTEVSTEDKTFNTTPFTV